MTRWLIAGWGRVGPAHATALGRCPGAEVVGAVAHNGTARGASPADSVHLFQDLEVALDETRPDALSIALPHDLHLPATELAARRGVHVLCEKPLARDLDECLRMIELCREHDVQLGCILNYRGYLQLRWVREVIASGAFEVLAASVDVALARTVSAPAWQLDPVRSGGGIARIVGVHYLDLLQWWLGRPLTVNGIATPPGLENIAAGCITFARGAVATVSMSAVASSSIGIRVELTADIGRIVIHGAEVVAAPVALGPLPPPQEFDCSTPYGTGHLVCLAEANEALAAGGPFPYSGVEGAWAVAMVDALYRSSALGRSEPVGDISRGVIRGTR